MSQRAKRRRLTVEQDFFSQPARVGQSAPLNGQLSEDSSLEEEIEKCTYRAVGAMMNQKTLKPFTAGEILSGMPARRKIGLIVIRRARELLYEVYGLKLVECETGKFIVCLPRDAKCRPFIDDSGNEPLKVLLAVSLSLICCHSGLLEQDILVKRYLPRFFPSCHDQGDQNYFGSVTGLMKELKTSMYLKEVPRENEAFLEIGPRALAEFNIKETVLPFLREMFQRIPPPVMKYLDSLPT